MANRTQDAARRERRTSSREDPRLVDHYGSIGIPAVAAAVGFRGDAPAPEERASLAEWARRRGDDAA